MAREALIAGGGGAPPWHRIRILLVAGIAGAAFAFLTWPIATLETRFTVALSAGIIVLSLGMMSIWKLEDFLVYLQVFNVPFAGFGKWLFPQQVITVAKGISLGLAEVGLFFGYLVWFCQVFIARSRPFPKFGIVDGLVAVIVLMQCLSTLGAPDTKVALFDTIWSIKFFLIYFYLAHKLERRHLKLVIVLLLFGLVVESPLALYERITGNVGLGRSKGDIGGRDFGSQYAVPGLEEIRAEGTTGDSHTLGNYLAMLLLIPVTLILMGRLSLRSRAILFSMLLIGTGGLIVTFSRAGWISFFLASCFLLAVSVLSWRRLQGLFAGLALVFAISLFFPNSYEYAINRLFDAPSAIMQVRYDLNWTAVNILSDHLFLGYGPGNFMEALNDPTINWIGTVELPVHNVFLYIAAESGIFAALSFFTITFIAMKRLWPFRAHPDWVVRGLAMAILAGLISFVLNGLTDPTFREPVPYSLFWVYVSIAVAMARMTAAPPAPQASPAAVAAPAGDAGRVPAAGQAFVSRSGT